MTVRASLSFRVQARESVLNALDFAVELAVGVCMAIIVAWLLWFRMKEIKQCWKLHVRIRYYLCLTIFGTAVYLALGIGGTINIIALEEPK